MLYLRKDTITYTLELALEVACFPGFSFYIKFCYSALSCYVWEFIKYASSNQLQLIFTTEFNNLRISTVLSSPFAP